MQLDGKYSNPDINIYAGFHPLTRGLFSFWENRTIQIKDEDEFHQIIVHLNESLGIGNVILFFDHHYAFDALPLGLGLGKYVDNVSTVLIPYAVHLDMGLGREGEPSLRYWIRTKAFQWFVDRITRGNPKVRFLPVVREFELETPRLRKVVDKKYVGINTHYLKCFVRTFSEKKAGQVCFLTPFSGIGFPGKPVLHKQLYRSIKLVAEKSSPEISYYFTGAYPEWAAFQNYYAPLFMEHKIVVRGPFSMPTSDYKAARDLVEAELHAIRKSADFTPPDYSNLLMK